MSEKMKVRGLTLVLLSSWAVTGLSGCKSSSTAAFCEESCATAGNGVCEDGRPSASASTCAPGTDCMDCGANLYAPPPAMPGTDPVGDYFGRPEDPRPDVTLDIMCSSPTGWYCTESGSGFVYRGQRGGEGSGGLCFSTLPYSCGTDRTCITGDDGFAEGCLLDGYTDTSARVVLCDVVGYCDTGEELEWCADVAVLRPIPPTWGRWDVGLWYQMGSMMHTYQVPSDPIPMPNTFPGHRPMEWCRALGATTYCHGEPCEGEADTCGGCPNGTSCVDGTCVGDGALRFTLQWSSSNDLDLYVRTPSGTTIYYGNRSADGGMLDRDDTNGGAGSVENVFFTSAPAGTYTYWVDNFSGGSASFTLTVFKGGVQADRRTGSLSAGAESTRFTAAYP